MLKTIFRILWWIKSSKEQHLFEIEIFCNIINVFTVTFDRTPYLWTVVYILGFLELNWLSMNLTPWNHMLQNICQMHDHVLHLCINLWTPCTASVWGEPLLKKSFSLSTSLMAPHQLKMFHCDDLPKHTKLLVSPMHRAQRIGWGRMHGNKWTSYTQGRLRTHQTCTHTSVFCSMDLSERTNNWTAVFVLNPLCIKCKRCTCWM